MTNKALFTLIISSVVLFACDAPKTSESKIHEDNYHGTIIQEPHRWLELDTAADVKAWVVEQNKVTNAYLSEIPFRDEIRTRLEEVYNYPKYSSPFRAGDYYFFFKNDGMQNQSVLYYQKGLNGEAEVFFDPNKLSEDGTVSFSIAGISKDNKYFSYRLSQSGSDWGEIHTMEIESKKKLDDVIRWTKFSGAVWYKDGFFYSAYDAPKEGEELSGKNEFHKVYYHQLGKPQSADELVYVDHDNPLRYHNVSLGEDERFLILTVAQGTDGYETHYKDLEAEDSDFIPLFTGFSNKSSVVKVFERANGQVEFLVRTDIDAPNYRAILVNPNNPEKDNWTTFIPEKEHLLQGLSTAGGKIFANYLQDVSSHVYQYSEKGELEYEITLPAIGSASGFSGKSDDRTIFYTFSSFTFPTTIYSYDIASGKSSVFRESEVEFNPEDYVVIQEFYASKDGTKVPMFIVHHKDVEKNGKNPTYLYAYGGFNISITPSFNPMNIPFLERGGIFVVANIRGGGEYGEEWHRAGMLEKKQNVFDDFIAAAEYLIAENYTSADHIAISGRSNGGLLVGAVMVQRPELFKVAFPAVGVLDMLRFHKFTVGWGWVDEYGSSDNPEDFKYLIKYSPLHNVKKGVTYPATMIMTADHDDRVVPAHSFKFAATLQEKHQGDNPILIRIETKAGHGAGKSTAQRIEDYVDMWSFLFYNME
jgi:prolyl oligopeptidase